MITILRGIIFFAFIISTHLIPMNLPTKEKEIIQWDTPQLQKALSGTYFSGQPKELLFHILIMLPSKEKDNLSKTCTAFNSLLSLKNIQPFMFCAELNASERTIKRLFIEAVSNRDKRQISYLLFHPHVQSFNAIPRINYTTLGSISSIGVELSSGNKLFLQDSNYSITDFDSFLMTALSPNIDTTQEELRCFLESSSASSLDFYLCTAIKKNDHIAAELICKNKAMLTSVLRFNPGLNYIYKLVQLGLYCRSDNFIDWLLEVYRKKLLSARISNIDIKKISGTDYLTNDFQSPSDPLPLNEIVSKNIEKLNQIYGNQKEKLHQYLFCLFVDNLNDFNLSKDEINAIVEKYKKSKKEQRKDSNKIKCVIQ